MAFFKEGLLQKYKREPSFCYAIGEGREPFFFIGKGIEIGKIRVGRHPRLAGRMNIFA